MWIRFSIARPVGLLFARTRRYRLEYSGVENAPYRGPFIVVANHQTGIDIFAVGLALRRALSRSRMVPWAKGDIRSGSEGFLARVLWYYFGAIPIERDGRGSRKAIRKSLSHLKKGHIIFIHPEGTRYPRGSIGPFMFGVANLARTVPVPILPVGVYRRQGDGGVQVNVGVPFFMPGLPPEEMEDVPAGRCLWLGRNMENLKNWSMELDRDRKGMKLIGKTVDLAVQAVRRIPSPALERFFMMATPEDNEYVRGKVLELLPPGWERSCSAEAGSPDEPPRDYVDEGAIMRPSPAGSAGREHDENPGERGTGG